jgi:hypothetical protein
VLLGYTSEEIAMSSALRQMGLRTSSRVMSVAITTSALCVAMVAVAPAEPPFENGPRHHHTSMPVPDVDATPVNDANTALTKAKADLKKAQAVLFGAARRFEKSIDAKPDVAAAMQELTVAQTSLQAATTNALSGIKSDASYKDAQTKAKGARADVEQLRGNPDATPDERYAAAKASLAANDVLSKIESTALAADSHVTDGRTLVAAKGEAVRKLRAQYETAMHDDAEWAAASKDVDEKKKNVETAEKQFADAQKTYADQLAARQAAITQNNKAQAQYGGSGGLYGMPPGTPPNR